jgi:hypothetical protein
MKLTCVYAASNRFARNSECGFDAVFPRSDKKLCRNLLGLEEVYLYYSLVGVLPSFTKEENQSEPGDPRQLTRCVTARFLSSVLHAAVTDSIGTLEGIVLYRDSFKRRSISTGAKCANDAQYQARKMENERRVSVGYSTICYGTLKKGCSDQSHRNNE